ncbi:DMT family transporter [Boseongicola aestuarii]|uniref:Riboflavin transporter n=1 Tax=Boseongicola aestuarii TaxID=1470561 RepID=A0A238IZU7_9RHOB|nr:DMT family transporter [Boseongicola aestuarii]SMX23522.1 Riboflavin transporter [Boseongicola aestuarii]
MTTTSALPIHRPGLGIFWMLVTGVLFVAVTALVKHGAQDLPAAQSAFMRYAIGLVFLAPLIKPIRAAGLSRRQVVLFGWRGVAHSIGVILWFFAMTRITVAEVTAMNYMAPIYITFGAALFLGETLAVRRILAIGLAFVGALIILRPGFRELSPGHFAMLATAVLFAISYLMAKQFSGQVSASVVVGMLSIFCTIGLAPFAFAVWQTPTMAEVGWMALVALFATAGHYTMTLAFAAAPVTVTQPVTYLQLIWATLLGLWAFGEPVDGWVLLGGLIIMTSVTFITIREAMLKRRREAASTL